MKLQHNTEICEVDKNEVDVNGRLTVTVLAVRAGVLLSLPGCSLCVCVGVYSVRVCSATVLDPV